MNRSISVWSAAAALALGSSAIGQPCEWSALGRGVDNSVKALAVFDDGQGEALYVGGTFQTAELLIVNHVAKWDGYSWAPVGAGLHLGFVYSFAVFDDGRGGGPALYAGGSFETSGGTQIRGVARWDGASWSEVGGGVAGARFGKPKVRALAVFDDGAGPALYAAGEFSEAGGVPVNYIAKWDGESWSDVGGGVGSHVFTLCVFDDGRGAALYAGGYLETAGGAPASHLAKWDGDSWSSVGAGLGGHVYGVEVFDDGSGLALYAGGSFLTAGGAPARYIAKWNGASWSEIGGGMSRTAGAFTVFDDGSGPALYLGGPFTMAGDTPANGVVRWDGKAWSALGTGVGGSPVSTVVALAAYDDGDGLALYAGGTFLTAGGAPANYIASWRCEQPPACPADCDGSGALDFLDFLCFQNRFAAADPLADCDGSTALDFFDFLCFQNAFGAGCP